MDGGFMPASRYGSHLCWVVARGAHTRAVIHRRTPGLSAHRGGTRRSDRSRGDNRSRGTWPGDDRHTGWWGGEESKCIRVATAQGNHHRTTECLELAPCDLVHERTSVEHLRGGIEHLLLLRLGVLAQVVVLGVRAPWRRWGERAGEPRNANSPPTANTMASLKLRIRAWASTPPATCHVRAPRGEDEGRGRIPTLGSRYR